VASVLALALGVALPAPAAAQIFGKNKVQYREFDFHVISSAHFDVYFYMGGDSLALRVLDLAEKAHDYLSREMGHALAHKVPIILYNSPNDFRQTNIITELLDEGTGGFTELFRNRVVLPFAGAYADLRHVVVHELVHAIMFDNLYGGGLGTFVGGGAFVQVPLWFAEGMAEWLSEGWTSEAEMFMRDGIISGYLPPLPYSGGFLVYKQGQAAMRFLEERYGEGRLRDLLHRMKNYRNFDRAFEAVMGTSVAAFNEDFDNWLKRSFWPEVRTKSNPEVFARRLTDHRKDRSNLNMGAALSPLGDRVAYFSDRTDHTDIYVMSSLDGKVLKRVVRGQRNVEFESIPSFRSSLTWSPDGRFLAFVAQSQARDVLYVSEVEDGEVRHKIKNEFDGLVYPAWHPTEDRLVVVAMQDGRSDLWLTDLEGNFERLTDDTWDEKDPQWSPDGKRIVFSSDRPHSIVLEADPHGSAYGDYGIYEYDLESRTVAEVVNTWGHDEHPVWAPDGERLLFISDRNGARDVYLMDPVDSIFVQLTEVQGGIYSLSWSAENDRVAFTGFNEGGWDIFIAKEPLSLATVVERLKRENPQSVYRWDDMREAGRVPSTLPPPGGRGALAASWPDSTVREPRHYSLERSEAPDTLRGLPLASDSLGGTLRPPPAPPADSILGEILPPRDARSESLSVLRGVRLPDSLAVLAGPWAADSLAAAVAPPPPPGGADQPFALPDSVLAQEPKPYRPQFSAEFGGGGLTYNSAFGLTGTVGLTISDFLGHHRIFVATDLFSGSLDQSNFLAFYNYLPKRTDYGVGLFHFNNFYFSRVSSLGEKFATTLNVQERNYGGIATVSYPFSRFRRFDIDFQQVFVDRVYLDEVAPGVVVETGHETKSVTAPTFSLTKDNVLYGFYGPVDGTRSFLGVTPTIPVFGNSLQYVSGVLDYRRYTNLGLGYQFVFRGVALLSEGEDAQVFEIGGFNTVRGFEDFSIIGNRVAFTNLEFRFPFINALGVLGPLPLGFFNLRGAAFTDLVSGSYEGDEVQLFNHDEYGKWGLKDLQMSFGGGVRSFVAFVIMKLDVAWRTDFRYVTHPIWQFSMGPEF
jgi:Tol biopolymer transport system component